MIIPKKEILYAPMLGTLGGGSARGFGQRGGGGADLSTLYDPFGDNSGRALYMFENNLNDESGNYNASMYSGSAQYSALIKKVGSYSFDSTGGDAAILDGLIQPETSPWTSMWWWYKSSNSGLSDNRRMVDFKENSTSKGTTVVFESDNRWHFVLRNNSGGTSNSKLVGSLNNGVWHHICVGASGTGSSQTAFVYVNGSLVDTHTNYNRSDSSESNGIIVGTGYGGDSQGFYDNFRLFNRALTASEIQQIYDSES